MPNATAPKPNEAKKVLTDCPCAWAPLPELPLRAPNRVMLLVVAGAEVVLDMLIDPSSIELRYDQGFSSDYKWYNEQWFIQGVQVTKSDTLFGTNRNTHENVVK